MDPKVHTALVIGSSRGLGAALAAALVARRCPQVIGVSRTPPEGEGGWRRDERYRHVALDVSAPESPVRLREVLRQTSNAPLLVIYNAAEVRSDLRPDGTIDFALFDLVNAVGVTGLGHVLRGVQDPLLARGGVFVGVSSFAALSPPVVAPRLAYPASKAYLDSALRALRHAWRGRVRVVTVHLGHIGGPGRGLLSRWIRPSYAMAAERILRRLTARRVPDEIDYTLAYAVAYHYLLPLVPDRLSARLLTGIAGSRLR
jgi:NAD(P)-dependent dehydrogenase (short-subunit alcohol dehydrogenase family)